MVANNPNLPLRYWIRFWFVIGCLYQAASPCLATHVVGGQIEMKALTDKPGHFSFSVIYYFDENQTYVPRGDEPLSIYRKLDNQYMDYVIVYNQTGNNRPLLPFSNQPCATQRNLVISVVRFSGETQLNPADYTDPEGYYIAFQTCCRNGGIDNIRDPVNTGYVFYLEFPPLIRQGKAFHNSSPVFDPIDGEYICLGDPFTFDFDAHDPDGDELRYSLVTPLSAFQSFGLLQVTAGPYPEIDWLPGYGPLQAIPGNPSLQIDAKTGQLSVTATQLGLFVFAVLVEEFRHGERIGVVQRDYQLLVVDCPPTIPPDPTITLKNQPVTTTSFCDGQTARLQATVNSGWNYQWLKDGVTMPGATTPALTVSEAGVYQLIIMLNAQCSKSRRSKKITVSVTKVQFRIRPATVPPLCKKGSSVQLEAAIGSSYRYRWYQDGTRLTTAQSATLSIDQPGTYWVTAQDTVLGCQSQSDSVVVRQGTPPPALIQTPASQTAICVGDSLPLMANVAPGYTYQWQVNGAAINGLTSNTYAVNQTGLYSVIVTDSAGCQATSASLSLSVVQPIEISLDSLPPMCAQPGLVPIALRGYPAGGTFSGPGVQKGYFDPMQAGAGQHRLTYTIRGDLACQHGAVSRTAIVKAPPQVILGPSLATWRGGTVNLPSEDVSTNHYSWTPSLSLDDSTKANPIASPQQTTRYTLTVKDQYGCVGSDTITVRVYERIWIPDAFSPNGDGVNDEWVLRGIEAYPEAEVTIYDRWGEVIYYSKGYSKPFDGRYKKQAVAKGLYPYVLNIDASGLIVKGTLVVL